MTKPTSIRPARKQPASKVSRTVAKAAKTPGSRKIAPLPAEQGSKTSACLELLRQNGGASLQELMAITGWQAHSVRGFLSGTVRKRLGLTLCADKDNQGLRRYHVKAVA